MDTDVMRRRKMPDLVLEFPSLLQGFLGMIYIVFSILLVDSLFHRKAFVMPF